MNHFNQQPGRARRRALGLTAVAVAVAALAVAACGGGGGGNDGPAPAPVTPPPVATAGDAFFATVADISMTTNEDKDAPPIEALAETAPEDTEPQAVTVE